MDCRDIIGIEINEYYGYKDMSKMKQKVLRLRSEKFKDSRVARQLTCLMGLLLFMFISGCANITAIPMRPGASGTPSAFPSPIATPVSSNGSPLVSITVPRNAATGVAINLKPTVTFTEPMTASTLNTSTFKLHGPDNALIAGSVTYVGRTATFRPTGNLTGNTLYLATITTGVQDLDGNAMEREFVWSFTTGSSTDTTAPQVASSFPDQAATNVPINFRPTVIFTEAMDPLTITNTTFTLNGPDNAPVAGSVTYIGTTATFQPTDHLKTNTVYTWGISTGAQDLAGNALDHRFEQTFTTGSSTDTTAPTVVSTDPLHDAYEVSTYVEPTVTFSEAMDPLSLNTTTFILRGPDILNGPDNQLVAGTVTYAGMTATFNPLNKLLASRRYTVTITTGSQDLAGNALGNVFEYTFKTKADSGSGGGGGSSSGNTSPTVISRVPAQGAIDVATNTAINATFSEAMKPLSLTTGNTFTLTGPGPDNLVIAGDVTYVGVTATFTPNEVLAADTVYTAKITTAAMDLGSHPLKNDAVWTFTTGDAPDNLAPTVISRVPAQGDTDMATNAAINAAFSEAMKPLSLTTGNAFTLTGPGPDNLVVVG